MIRNEGVGALLFNCWRFAGVYIRDYDIMIMGMDGIAIYKYPCMT